MYERFGMLMKIAVLADIHSNFIVLQEAYEHIVVWKPDIVVVAGDIVNRGPNPFECVQFLHHKSLYENWIVILGNHEEYVIDKTDNLELLSEYEHHVHKPSIWTGSKIKSELNYIKSLPLICCLMGPDQNEIRILHGSMLGTRDGIYPETSPDNLRRKIVGEISLENTSDLPSVFCVGHTHRPFIKSYQNTLIINVGSIGLSFDSDPRLAYAQLYWDKGNWNSQIVRLDYDISEAEKNFHKSGYLAEAGPLVKIVQKELRISRSLLYYWASEYQDKVLKGNITIEDLVDLFLSDISGGAYL